MASRASDWLDSERLGQQLRISAEHPHADRLPDYVAGAVQFVAGQTGLPLLDVYRTVEPPVPDLQRPIRLGRVLAFLEVSAAWWWSDPDRNAVGEGTALTRLEGGDPVPDVGRWEPTPETSTDLAPDVRLFPPPAGWPPTMRRLRLRLRQGLIPAEHPILTDGCILAARASFEGIQLADKRSALERLLEPTQYFFVEHAPPC